MIYSLFLILFVTNLHSLYRGKMADICDSESALLRSLRDKSAPEVLRVSCNLFRRRDSTPPGLRVLFDALIESAYISSINLSYHRIGGLSAPLLAELIRENTSLTHIDLTGNGLKEAGLIILTEALCQNTHIKSLDLSSNKLKGESLHRFASAVLGATEFRAVPSLVSLNLSNATFSAEAIRIFSAVLSTNCTLTDLNLSQCRLKRPLPYLADALAQNTTLRKFVFDFCPVPWMDLGRHLVRSLHRSNSLETLSVAYSYRMYIDDFASCIQDNVSWTSLNVSFCSGLDTTASIFCEALKTNTNLTELNAASINFPDILGRALLENRTLRTLNLRGSKGYRIHALSDEVWADDTYAQVLSKPGSSLTSLDVSSCNFSDGHCRAIAEAMMVNVSLTFLSLASNAISNETNLAMAHMLTINSTLVHLDVSASMSYSQECEAAYLHAISESNYSLEFFNYSPKDGNLTSVTSEWEQRMSEVLLRNKQSKETDFVLK